MPFTLSNEKVCSRNSHQSETGSLWPWKIVPVMGVKDLPQDLQRHLRTPLRSRPLPSMSFEWHLGHSSRRYPLKKATSRSADRAEWR